MVAPVTVRAHECLEALRMEPLQKERTAMSNSNQSPLAGLRVGLQWVFRFKFKFRVERAGASSTCSNTLCAKRQLSPEGHSAFCRKGRNTR
jgi:hypothetical protein